jgi:hypothetical protein
MNTMDGYFPFMIVHVKWGYLQHPQLFEWFYPPEISHLVLLIPTSDGPSRRSRIYFTHAHLANSGYMVDVVR